jgi:hypothetical protein
MRAVQDHYEQLTSHGLVFWCLGDAYGSPQAVFTRLCAEDDHGADNVDSSEQLSCLVSWLSLMLYFGPFGDCTRR